MTGLINGNDNKVSMVVGRRMAEGQFFRFPAMYFLGYLCIYIKSFVAMTSFFVLPETLDRLLLLAGLFFLLIHVFSNSEKYGSRFIPLLLVILSAAYSYLVSGQTIPITAVMLIVAGATAGDVRNLANIWFRLSSFLFCFVLALYLLTALFDPSGLDYVLRFEGGVVVAVRFSLFFSHPNMASAFIMMICGTYMYLNYQKLNLRIYVWILAVAVLAFAATDSRTSFVLTIMEVALFICQKKWNIFSKKKMRNFVSILPTILFILVYLISGPFYNSALGDLLTGRLSLWHQCFVNQGVTFFGQAFLRSTVVSDTGWVSYFDTIDCAYASGLFVYGLVFSLFFCYCVFELIRGAEAQASAEIPLLIVLFLFGITEVHAFNPIICAPLLFLSGGVLPHSRREANLF